MVERLLLHTLLRWSLGKTDARILWSELQESYRCRAEAEGQAAANRWLRRELLQAVLLYVKLCLRRSAPSRRRENVPRRLVPPVAAAASGVVRDVGFAIRTLRKKPLFTIISIDVGI